MKVKTTPYNLCVYFPIESQEVMIAKKYLDEKFGNTYMEVPHVTVLIIPIPKYHFVSATAELSAYLKTLPKITFKTSKLLCNEKKFFFSININDENLKQLHLDLLEVTTKFRDDYMREKDLKRIETIPNYFNARELKSIENLGFPHSGDEFEAHITIGELKKPEGFDLQTTEKDLNQILANTVNAEYNVKKVEAVYGIDASQPIIEWSEEYELN